jgi:hypothetical protein
MSSVLFPGMRRIASGSTRCYFVALYSRYSIKLRTILTLIHFIPLHSQLHFIKHRTYGQPGEESLFTEGIKKHTLTEHLHVHCRRQPIFIANQMFEHPTQPSSIVLEIANAQAIFLMKQDDDDVDREISNQESQDPAESTMLSNIEEDDLDIRQEVLHLDQACRNKTIRITRVLLPKNRSYAENVIANAPLPNLRHPAGAIVPPLLKCQKSVINISRESDVVQVLPLPKAGEDQNVPQPKAGGDHNIPQYQNATFEVAKRFMQAIVFTKTPLQRAQSRVGNIDNNNVISQNKTKGWRFVLRKSKQDRIRSWFKVITCFAIQENE